MFLRKMIRSAEANILIAKAPDVKPRLQVPKKRFYKVFKSFLPHHWFDGFMDEIKIELKEME